jgi:Na+/H+ antiporter NhaC
MAEAPRLVVGGEAVPLSKGEAGGTWTAEGVTVSSSGSVDVQVLSGDGAVMTETTSRVLPGWISILPPVIAIAMALTFKRVVPALFFGVFMGAVLAVEVSFTGLFKGLLDTIQVYVLSALANEGHASIILFSLMIGGMVGIISKNGGTLGIVDRITSFASDSRRGQVVTGLLGLGIFFDDYANTLVVGNTMRPVTDKLRISREKLAYIVDSTAAPVACLAFVTTWIGYEVGIVGTAVANIEGLTMSAYSIFLNSILYSFYPLLALYFVFVVANSKRDFGPMARAERRARETGQVMASGANVDEAAGEGEELKAKDDAPRYAFNAVVPVLVLVVTVLGGLYWTGLQSVADPTTASLSDIIGEADSYKALMWGSLLGVLVAAVLSVGQRILTLEETVEAWYAGLKSMLFAMIILVLAWALSEITTVLHTAEYLTSVLGDWLPAGAVPAVVFLMAAATAFATGSSWGTMGILMPLVVPVTWEVLGANGMADPAHYHILYSAVSCVLAGSVWGDHCSPISDTTILSSMASGCDHIDHVRTQLPYAMSVGVVALLVGTLPAGFGMPWWVGLLIGMAILSTLLRVFGEEVEIMDPNAESHTEPATAAAGQ